MTKTYRLFRVYCFVCVSVLCVLLVVIGFLTAKYQTEETVFKSTHSTVRVYSSSENIVMNMAGKVVKIREDEVEEAIDKVSPIIFMPIDNVIELIKAIRG